MKDKRMIKDILWLIMFVLAALMPMTTYAKTSVKPKAAPLPAPLEISGWIPYWRTATGTVDAMAHLAAFKEINPFGYTVKQNGVLFDALHIDSPSWQTLMQTAREKKIRVIPTVMWSNTEAIHTVLKSKKLRTAHIKEIMKAVKNKDRVLLFSQLFFLKRACPVQLFFR